MATPAGTPHIPRRLQGAIGKVGAVEFAGYFFEESLTQLQQWSGQRIYREMADGDPIVGGVLFAIEMLVRQAEWSVAPARKDAEAQADAQLVDECLGDMAITWQDTLAELLSMLVFGWAYMEQTYKYRDGDSQDPERASKYTDGKVGWASWGIRAQETLLRWEFDEPGNLLGLWQLPPPDYKLRFIPIDKALLFKTTSRKGNPEGFSILRRAYTSWYLKTNIQRIEAIGIERDLAGMPVAWVPPEVIAAPDQSLYESYKTLVTNLRNDEQAGVVLPLQYDEHGNKQYDLTLLTTGGSRQIETDPIVARYDQRIAGSMLADFMLLGQEQVGSFALSHDKTALFTQALGTILDTICAVVNRFAIPRLLRLNGRDVSRGTPELRHGDVSTPDLGVLGAYLQALSTAGLNVAGMADGKWLLETAGVPTLATLSGPDQPDTTAPEPEDAQKQADWQQKPLPPMVAGKPGQPGGNGTPATKDKEQPDATPTGR